MNLKLILIGALMTGLVIFLFRGKSDTEKSLTQTLDENKSKIDPAKVLFTDGEISEMAERLYTALNHYLITSVDSRTVIRIIEKLKSSDEYYAIEQRFGIREINGTKMSLKLALEDRIFDMTIYGPGTTGVDQGWTETQLGYIKRKITELGVKF